MKPFIIFLNSFTVKCKVKFLVAEGQFMVAEGQLHGQGHSKRPLGYSRLQWVTLIHHMSNVFDGLGYGFS